MGEESSEKIRLAGKDNADFSLHEVVVGRQLSSPSFHFRHDIVELAGKISDEIVKAVENDRTLRDLVRFLRLLSARRWEDQLAHGRIRAKREL